MSRLGVDREIAELAIGHKRTSLDALYIFDEAWQLRCEAFAKVSDHVAQLLARAAAEGKGVPGATRTRAGTACQRPALRGRHRCRLHGGLSPGAPRGMENGNFRNGNWTAEAIEERRWLRSLVSINRSLVGRYSVRSDAFDRFFQSSVPGVEFGGRRQLP